MLIGRPEGLNVMPCSSLKPLHRRWTRVTPKDAAFMGSVAVNWVVSTSKDLSSPKTKGSFNTAAARDFTVKVGRRPGSLAAWQPAADAQSQQICQQQQQMLLVLLGIGAHASTALLPCR